MTAHMMSIIRCYSGAIHVADNGAALAKIWRKR